MVAQSIVTRTQAIATFLKERTHADLAARFNEGMEVQVNVAQGRGEPSEEFLDTRDEHGRRRTRLIPNTYNDPEGDDKWYSYRIPKQANSEPKSNDYRQSYDLSCHAEAIGITGWHWKQRRSVALGFDFDAIVGHAEGVGITARQLEQVKQAACGLDYVEARKSTSGTGIHLWVMFDPDNLPETANHTEHAALGRAVLLRMAYDCGFDFAAAVDCFGHNMWIWARKMTEENDGLAHIKPATRPLKDYPQDWREHLEVVTRKRKRTRVKGARNDDDAAAVEKHATNRPRIKLDPDHKKFMRLYEATDFEGYWQQDHGLFTAHTCGIASIFEELELKGVFQTISEGNNPTQPNCFMYPLPGGAWRVFRYSSGGGEVKEAETWELSPHGWTTCAINVTPTLEQVAKAYNGIRRPTKNESGYVFKQVADAEKAVAAFGGELGLPKWAAKAKTARPVTLTIHKAGGLHAEFPFDETKDNGGRVKAARDKGWMKERGPVWAKFIDAETQPQVTNYENLADDCVRHVSEAGEQVGLFVHTNTAGWEKRTLDQAKTYLLHKGIAGGLQQDLLGWCSDNPYQLVRKPFQPEYPGNREWNRNGAKLRFAPSDKVGPTPWWDNVLTHLGEGLDDTVQGDSWCQEHGIESGADYLRRWIANLIRYPERRLPLLAMYSEAQDVAGKSALHEGVCELFATADDAFTFGDGALQNKQGFNGELHGKALCVVEETNLATSRLAYDRIKAWVTNPSMQIHPKGFTSFPVANVSHWIVCTNDFKSVPIAPGDERIVLWEVKPLEKKRPKEELLKELRKEGPFFLRQLMDLDIAAISGRQTLPVLLTAEKVEAMAVSPIEAASLDGVRLKLAQAIVEAVKSNRLYLDSLAWEGTAEQLTEKLGDWDGEAEKKSLKSRSTRVGVMVMQTTEYLKDHGILLEREGNKKRRYVLKKIHGTPSQ